MHLGMPTLLKFAREALVTPTPLVLGDAGIAELQTRLETWFAGGEDLAMRWEGHASRHGDRVGHVPGQH